MDQIIDTRKKLLNGELAYLKKYKVIVTSESLLNDLKTSERLGKGSFGDVFKVKLKENEDVMALKRIQLSGMQDIDERLLREVIINEQLSHPNIVIFYHYGIEFDKLNGIWLYMLMELCHDNLAHWLEHESQPRDYHECMKKFMNICNGIEYIHGKGFFHRDLKPNNILISLNNDTCKIADFGLAKLNETAANCSHTSGIGTPIYAAPEQLENTHYDNKVDLFSLGLILMEFLVEFNDKLRHSTFNQMREESVFPAGLIKNQFAREGQLILRMTKTRPEERPDINQVIQDMNQYLNITE
jgi:serine/threonine protein kinase